MKPIDWTKVKSGDRFTARIDGKKIDGEIHISEYVTCRLVRICFQMKDTLYFWFLPNNRVKNLKIISQNKTKPMAKKTKPTEDTENSKAIARVTKFLKNVKKSSATEKIKTLTGANWHIAQEKKGFSTKLVAKNGKVNRYDKGFNNRQNAMTNITSSVRNGFIDDGIFIEAMIAAKTRQDVVDAISAYGYLKGKRTELIAGVTVKNGKRVDAVKKVVKAKK